MTITMEPRIELYSDQDMTISIFALFANVRQNDQDEWFANLNACFLIKRTTKVEMPTVEPVRNLKQRVKDQN